LTEQDVSSDSIRRWAIIATGAVAFLAVTGLAGLEWRSRRRFDVPYPALAAATDAATIARGAYLVYGAAACAYCHVPRERWPELDRGERLPLTGHHRFPLPFGILYSPNLTPDRDTGIGAHADAALARMLTRGVRADGRAAFPIMEIQLADDDIVAVMSYLRSQPAVAHRVPEHRLTLLGKALMAFAIGPPDPPPPRRATSPAGATIERGDYLANHVSSCVACHTDRGENGALVGPAFAGGQRMDVAADPARVYVSPNLTPDPETSPIGQWTEDDFVARFRVGPLIDGTPMPWGAFARLTDEDLRAIFRYLRSLPATRHLVGPPVQKKAG
jgi:mono/diheme cytochrome c family protein